MNIGELFIKIGLKGFEKSIADLDKIEKKIKKIATLSNNSFQLNTNKFTQSTASINKGLATTIKSFQQATVAVSHFQSSLIGGGSGGGGGGGSGGGGVIGIGSGASGSGGGQGGSGFLKNFINRFKLFANILKNFSISLKNIFQMKFSGNLSKAFSSIGRGLKGVTTLSRTAKVAILAAIYAFSRMAMKVGGQATSATNTTAYTGMNVETLQKYQHIAAKNESSADAMSESFRKLSESLGEFLTLGKAPEGWLRLQEIMGRSNNPYSQEEVDYFRRNPNALLQEVQEYAKREPIGWIRNRNIDELFGSEIGDLIRRQLFTQKALSNAPFTSKEDIDYATKAKARINEILLRIEDVFGKFIIEHGEVLLNSIEKILPGLLELVKSLAGLLTNKDAIAGFRHLIDMLADSLKGINVSISGTPEEQKAFAEQHNQKAEKYRNILDAWLRIKFPEVFKYIETVKEIKDRDAKSFQENVKSSKGFFDSLLDFAKQMNDAYTPEDMIHKSHQKDKTSPSDKNTQSNVFNINNSFKFDASDVKNPRLVASSFAESIKDAYLNLPLTIGV